MPTRKPADVWDAPADTPRIPAPTAPEPAPAPKPPPAVTTPPGPIHLELRINNRTYFVQRVYSYSIDQTNPNHTVITAHLTPTDARND